MNPDRIYRQYKDDALAKQFSAEEYSTFVAMPFKDRFSYRSTEIYSNVIQAAAQKANEKQIAKRRFAKPERVDDPNAPALVITENIIVKILESHLFIADLTFQNPGVLTEVGIALGLKPNDQIILITQGNLDELHFDLRNNNVISYNDPNALEKLAQAYIASANAFELSCERYIASVRQKIGIDAIACLMRYGELYHKFPNSGVPLHYGNSGPHFEGTTGGEIRFSLAISELRANNLLYTDYAVDYKEDGTFKQDRYGMHPTEIGWLVIENLWPFFRRELIQTN